MRKGIGMATESGRTVLLTRCLQLNVLALAFSLAHVVADWHIGLFGASSAAMSAPQAALLWLVSGLYAWWGLSLAAAARGARSGLLSLVALSAGWAALGNGLPIVFCLPPCPGAFPHQDIAHVGSLLFGGWAAHASWRAARASEQPPGRAAWALPAVALAAVVALFALQASLAPP